LKVQDPEPFDHFLKITPPLYNLKRDQNPTSAFSDYDLLIILIAMPATTPMQKQSMIS